ncbi:MAG: metallophosphoesterase [Nitrososphaerales archaeon]
MISDTHDNLDNLRKVLKRLKEAKIKILIHCGDFCAPFVIDVLKEINVEKIYGVFGNVDGDRFRILEKKPNNMELYPELGEFEIDKRKIALVHYPQFAMALALSKKYDAIFYGHTHIPKKERINGVLLLNPGEIHGLKGKPTYAIYYPNENDADVIEL